MSLRSAFRKRLRKAEHPDEYYSGSQPGSRTNPRRAEPPYPGFGAESQRRDRAIAPVTERQLQPRKESKRSDPSRSAGGRPRYGFGRRAGAEAMQRNTQHFVDAGRTAPQVASQGPRAKRRAGAQAQEQMPRKQSKDFDQAAAARRYPYGHQMPRKESKDWEKEERRAPSGGGRPMPEPKVIPQETGAQRRARWAAREQIPRKQSKDILMGTGQTPQAGKPKQGVWQAHTHGGETHEHGQRQPVVPLPMGPPYHRQSKAEARPSGSLPAKYRRVHEKETMRRLTGKAAAAGTHTHGSGSRYPAHPATRRHRGVGTYEPQHKLPDVTEEVHRNAQPAARRQSKDIVGKMQGAFRKRWTGKADPHGGPAGGQGRLHGHMGPGGETHEHDYGEHGGVKISPPARPKPASSPGPGQSGGRSPFDEEHKRKFGYARKAVSQSVVSPHPAPSRGGGVPEKHQLSIARANARMHPAMRGVMGAGDVHEHSGAAHSHPDAWDANDAVSHTHKAVRKHYGGEPRTKPMTHPHFGNRGTPGGTQHTHPPEFPAEIKKAAGEGSQQPFGYPPTTQVHSGKGKGPVHGHSSDVNRYVSSHGHAGGAAAHHHQATTNPRWHSPYTTTGGAVKAAVRLAMKAVQGGGDPVPPKRVPVPSRVYGGGPGGGPPGSPKRETKRQWWARTKPSNAQKAVRLAMKAVQGGGDPVPPKVPQSKLQTPKQRERGRQQFAREQWGGPKPGRKEPRRR